MLRNGTCRLIHTPQKASPFFAVNRPEQFALLCSWLLGIGTAGNLLAASPLAWAASAIGWRNAMLAIAAATAISAVSIFLMVRDPKRIEHHDSKGFIAGLGEILSIRALWPLLPLTAVGYSAVLSERGLWAGPYFSDVHGLLPVARGNALLAMAAAMSAGAMLYGPLDRILGTRKWVVAGGSAVTAAGFLALGIFDLSLPQATIAMATLGAFGMTYGVLMAHVRSFVPDHLLGRGITLMNVLFLGGAGVLQPFSGALMKAMQGGPPAQAYMVLHVAFGAAVLAALVVYLFSTEQPAEKIPPIAV